MMLQKIPPDFDAAVEGILWRDPTGHVIFFNHFNAGWERDLAARFDVSISADVRNRVVFLRWMHSKDDFASMNAHASVVIDPFHFGIGSTAITNFAVGTPIVTWRSTFLLGHVGLIYCHLLGLDECVASSREEYVVRAVQIATDTALREVLSQRIVESSMRANVILRAYEDTFMSSGGLCNQKPMRSADQH
jgi:protein O-GlcNAc transferase